MIRILQIITVSALISTVVVLTCCISNLLQDDPKLKWTSEPPIIEKFRQTRDHRATGSRIIKNPLIREAEMFARYLNPPEIKKSPKTSVSSSSTRTISVSRQEILSPKFTLAATSYYRSKPKESMALVWEPGTGFHWIKQGMKLGHFIIDKIERGKIVYQYGDLYGQMVINQNVPIYNEQIHKTMSVSTQTHPASSSVPSKQEMKTDELSVPNREALPIVKNNDTQGIGS